MMFVVGEQLKSTYSCLTPTVQQEEGGRDAILNYFGDFWMYEKKSNQLISTRPRNINLTEMGLAISISPPLPHLAKDIAEVYCIMSSSDKTSWYRQFTW